jgi:hypothetical protein
MAATALRGIKRFIPHIGVCGPLDLRWSESELRCPSIVHGPRGSQLSFSLSPVTDVTYGDLSAAQQYNIPVRLASLKRPLHLEIAHLERVGDEAQISGRIVPSALLQ